MSLLWTNELGIHKTLDDASQSITNQYSIIKVKKGGKIISEEFVDVIFEGIEVKAKKVVYDFKSVKILAGWHEWR